MIVDYDYVLDRFHYDYETGYFYDRKGFKLVSGRNGNGYLYASIGRKTYLIHRLAFLYMKGSNPTCIVDHINGVRDDNRWVNLRDVSVSGNAKNRKLTPLNTSGIPGVGWVKGKSKWHARINSDGNAHSIGMYFDFFEACCARKSAELEYGFHINHGRKV